jgi:hypothetical protein
LGDDWDKVGGVFVAAAVCEIVGCGIGSNRCVRVFVIVVYYSVDIICIDASGAGNLGCGCEPEGIVQIRVVGVDDDIISSS